MIGTSETSEETALPRTNWAIAVPDQLVTEFSGEVVGGGC